MIIWYGFDVIMFYERKVNMKAVPIALFIVSLILPAGSTSLADTVADNQSPYGEPGEAILALEYSDERSVEKGVKNPSIRWHKRKNNTINCIWNIRFSEANQINNNKIKNLLL